MDAAAAPLFVASKHIRRHHGPRRLLLILPVLALVAGAIVITQPRPTLGALGPSQVLSLTAPVTLNFNWPVARSVRATIFPHIEGELTYGKPLLGSRLYRSATFTPATTWQPGTTYRLTLTEVTSAVPGWQRAGEYSLSFTTASAPRVLRTSPDSGAVITADTAWRVTFDRPLDATSNVAIALLPDIPLRTEVSDDGLHYVVTPTQLLPQGETVHLRVQLNEQKLFFGTKEVASQGEAVELLARSWLVRTAPGVQAFSPQGTNASLAAPITVTLTEAVDRESFMKAVAIVPPVGGEWTTTDGKAFTLTHEPLTQRTTYTLTLASSLRTQAGGFFPEGVASAFSTIGPVVLASSAPAHTASGVSVQSALRVTFDQPVDQADTVRRMRISPAIAGKTSWQGNTLTFTPTTTLAFNTTYTVTFARGIVGAAGFPSATELTVQFSTERSTTRLAVPFHRQEHALSCEVATLVMALRYRGVNIGEQPLIDAIGFDPTPKQNGVWGDPDLAFVGDIDGQQPGTGYGVYAAPLAKAGSAYRPTRVLANATLANLLTEVKAGNPVIVWGNAATGRRVDWKTPSGKTVLAIVGEHTRVLIGFVGSVSNPTTIITMDPLVGEKRFTKAAFLADWALLGNMGVVVE